MPSTQQFRKRIRSVKNTSQITRAMEMVASVKMQKAVKTIMASRRYIQNAWNLLTRLTALTASAAHPLLQTREIKKICLIVITSDRGLAGSYNTDITRKLSAYLNEINESNHLEIIAIGKKGSEFVRKTLPDSLIAEFPGFDTGVNFEDIAPIAKIAVDGYIEKKYDQVVAIYSHFQSSIKQIPVKKQILPIAKEHIDLPEIWETEEKDEIEYKFEPDIDTILTRVTPQFIRAQLFGALLEANASEQSARMVAMKSATDNAKDLIDDLTLTYNSIRQDSITREIAEIAGAVEAMQ